MTESDTIYTAEQLDDLNAEQLQEIATERELEVEGTGKDGNVLVGDLRAAILAGQNDDVTESEPPDAANPEADPTDVPKTGSREIVRQTDTAWWCPFCDHSMHKLLNICTKCGAERDDDEATR